MVSRWGGAATTLEGVGVGQGKTSVESQLAKRRTSSSATCYGNQANSKRACRPQNLPPSLPCAKICRRIPADLAQLGFLGLRLPLARLHLGAALLPPHRFLLLTHALHALQALPHKGSAAKGESNGCIGSRTWEAVTAFQG